MSAAYVRGLNEGQDLMSIMPMERKQGAELAALSFGKLAGIAGELAERAIRKKLGLD